MNELQASEDLVEEKLDVVIGEGLVTFYDLGEIGLHQFIYNIDFFESRSTWWFKNCFDSYDVVVLQQPHDFKFSESSLSKHFVFKCFFNFLNSYQVIVGIICLDILCSHHHSVGSRPNWINDFISFIDFKSGSEDHVDISVSVSTSLLLHFIFLLF